MKVQVFELADGDRFIWKGRGYTVCSGPIEDDTMYVIEDGVDGIQRFNPYCEVEKVIQVILP